MKAPNLSLLNINLRWFLLGMILANIAGQMAYSMLSLYLVDLGASIVQVGLVFTIASIIPIVLQIFGGWFSDTVGRLRAIAIGSSIAVFGYLIFFTAPSWEWVMLGLSVEFVSNSFVGPSFSAYIAEQSSEKTRGRVYGLSTGIYMVVTVIGPALAGFLSYRMNFRYMMAVAFVFYLLATIVRIWMALSERFKPSKASERPTWNGLTTQMKAMFAILFSGGILTWIWISDAIGDTSYMLTGELLPIYFSKIGDLTVAQIGLLGSAWGIASIAGSFLGGWLTDRKSERVILTAGFFLISMGMIAVVVAQTSIAFLMSRIIAGLGVGILLPAYNSLISKVVPEDKRGLAFGFFGTSLGILSLPMPWIGAQLWENISPQAPFWITALLCALTIPIAWKKFSLPKTIKEIEIPPDLEIAISESESYE
ncbi:MAG TPA: MFS transporter [Anaerolineaceae bacterium]|nr:MFS transporter [Anaerolineaceae bacterium]